MMDFIGAKPVPLATMTIGFGLSTNFYVACGFLLIALFGAALWYTAREVEALVRDTRAAVLEFRQLTQSLRDRPSQLIYEPAPQGVEIPR